MLSKEKDHWLEEKYEFEAYWVAELSNGETIYQDDYRDGVNPPSAWERLGIYCSEKNLDILKLSVKWRSQNFTIGQTTDGFFFCRSILGNINSKDSIHYYILGTLQNGVLRTVKYRVPDMAKCEEEVRDENTAGICLIRNASGRQKV